MILSYMPRLLSLPRLPSYLDAEQAIKKQKAFLSKGEEEKDDRKRKYNSMTSTEVIIHAAIAN